MKIPHTEFGETKMFPVVTYTDGKKDDPPKTIWRDTLWIERAEDWYALENSSFAKGTLRIIERSAWMKCHHKI